MSPELYATVVITTKNRKEDLRRAITSCLGQSLPVEVLVMDDGSTDGTPQMVGSEFGDRVCLQRSEESTGYIVKRNLGAKLAQYRIIFSLDDDAAFSTPYTVEQTLAEFGHPRVGAVSIPRIDVNRPGSGQQAAPSDGRVYVMPAFVGCCHALRKDLFLHLGGYRDYLFHQGEENEYCARMLRGGYLVQAGRADPVEHYESPRRDSSRQFVFAARNNLLLAWYHVPMPQLVVHALGVVMNQYRWGLSRRHPIWTTQGIFAGIGAMLHERSQRQPLSRQLYHLLRRLVRDRMVPLEEIEPLLPPIQQDV